MPVEVEAIPGHPRGEYGEPPLVGGILAHSLYPYAVEVVCPAGGLLGATHRSREETAHPVGSQRQLHQLLPRGHGALGYDAPPSVQRIGHVAIAGA